MFETTYISPWVLVFVCLGSIVFIALYVKFSKKTVNSDTFDKVLTSSIISLVLSMLVLAVVNGFFAQKIVVDNPVTIEAPHRIVFLNIGDGPLLVNDYRMNKDVVASKIASSLQADDITIDGLQTDQELFAIVNDYRKVSFHGVRDGDKISGTFYFNDCGLIIQVHEKTSVKEQRIISL